MTDYLDSTKLADQPLPHEILTLRTDMLSGNGAS